MAERGIGPAVSRGASPVRACIRHRADEGRPLNIAINREYIYQQYFYILNIMSCNTNI
jgi:hypothetical protein